MNRLWGVVGFSVVYVWTSKGGRCQRLHSLQLVQAYGSISDGRFIRFDLSIVAGTASGRPRASVPKQTGNKNQRLDVVWCTRIPITENAQALARQEPNNSPFVNAALACDPSIGGTSIRPDRATFLIRRHVGEDKEERNLCVLCCQMFKKVLLAALQHPLEIYSNPNLAILQPNFVSKWIRGYVFQSYVT